MPVYNLIKDGNIVNTIVAEEVESIRNQYDSIEEVAPTEPAPQVATVDVFRVRENLTLAEKVKWDNSTTPSIVTAKVEFQSPKEVVEATEVLNFLVSEGDISQASVDKILAQLSVSRV